MYTKRKKVMERHLVIFYKFIQAQFAKDSINDSFGLCILVEKLAKLIILSCIFTVR